MIDALKRYSTRLNGQGVGLSVAVILWIILKIWLICMAQRRQNLLSHKIHIDSFNGVISFVHVTRCSLCRLAAHMKKKQEEKEEAGRLAR